MSLKNTTLIADLFRGNILLKFHLAIILLLNVHYSVKAQISKPIKTSGKYSSDFSSHPLDSNRSVIYGYLEFDDCGYEFTEGDQFVLDVRMLKSNHQYIANYFRTCKEENYLNLSAQKKMKGGKKNAIIETDFPLQVKELSFGCYNCKENRSFDAYLQKIGKGYFFYLCNVSNGDWEINELILTKEVNSSNRIVKRFASGCDSFEDYLPFIRGYTDYAFVNYLNEKWKLRILKDSIYYLGSYRISENRDVYPKIVDSVIYDPCARVLDIGEFIVSASADSVSAPNHNYLLHLLDSLSNGSKWHSYINGKISSF
jgi:hypothetical protein